MGSRTEPTVLLSGCPSPAAAARRMSRPRPRNRARSVSYCTAPTVAPSTAETCTAQSSGSDGERCRLWATTGGVFFNLGSWGVRWVAAHDRELEIITRQGGEMPWLWRYIPFANLYDLSLAFAFGAGITTLLIAHRPSFRFLGAVSLPAAALILILARFIGAIC